MSEEQAKREFAEKFGELLSQYYPRNLGIKSMRFYNRAESRKLVSMYCISAPTECVVIEYEGGGHHIAYCDGDSLWGMLEDIVKAAY